MTAVVVLRRAEAAVGLAAAAARPPLAAEERPLAATGVHHPATAWELQHLLQRVLPHKAVQPAAQRTASQAAEAQTGAAAPLLLLQLPVAPTGPAAAPSSAGDTEQAEQLQAGPKLAAAAGQARRPQVAAAAKPQAAATVVASEHTAVAARNPAAAPADNSQAATAGGAA